MRPLDRNESWTGPMEYSPFGSDQEKANESISKAQIEEVERQREAQRNSAATMSRSEPLSTIEGKPGFLTTEYSGRKYAEGTLTGAEQTELMGWFGYGGETLTEQQKGFVSLYERGGVATRDFYDMVKEFAHEGNAGRIDLTSKKFPILWDALNRELGRVEDQTRGRAMSPGRIGDMTEKATIRALNSAWRFYREGRDAFLSEVKESPGRADVDYLLNPLTQQKQLALFSDKAQYHALKTSLFPETWNNYVNMFRGKNRRIPSDPKAHSHLAMLADFRVRTLNRAFGEERVGQLLRMQEGEVVDDYEQQLVSDEEGTGLMELGELGLNRGAFTKEQLMKHTGLSEEEVMDRLRKAQRVETKGLVFERYQEAIEGNYLKDSAILDVGTAYNAIVNGKLKEKRELIATKISQRSKELNNIFRALNGGGALVNNIGEMLRDLKNSQPEAYSKFMTNLDTHGLGGNKLFADTIGKLISTHMINNEQIKGDIQQSAAIVAKALAGKILINNNEVTALEAIDNFTIPFTPEELLHMTMMTGYRAMAESKPLWKRYGRNYDERIPEDEALRMAFGDKLVRFGSGAALEILDKLNNSYGKMTPGGFRTTFQYSKIPSYTMGFARNYTYGYDDVNLLMYFGGQD